MTDAAEARDGDLSVRPPLQERTRRQWARVLDSGVEILENGGYDAFTIAAVCERAHVPPRALYARVDSKDALFLAVYDHGMARIAADNAPFADDARWVGLSPAATVAQAVDLVLDVFAHHAALLRAVVLLSSAHPEVTRRGSGHARRLQDLFVERCAPSVSVRHRDRDGAARTAFDTVFAAAAFRVAYGPSFLGTHAEEEFRRGLIAMQVAFLTDAPGPGP